MTLRCHLNLPYGSDHKHKLDVYCPARPHSSSPVFIFLHGGGFREGDRAEYGFVASPLAESGILTVVPSYRLTPSARYPDQNMDTRAVVEWVYRNIGEYGGDRTRVYIGGHSAGGILSASVGLDTSWLSPRGLPPDAIKGVAPISAEYDLRDSERFAAFNEYLPDPASRQGASPAMNIDRPAHRAVVAVGSIEPHVKSSEDLVARLRKDNVDAELLILSDLAHDQTALALGTPSDLIDSIVRMCRQ